MKKLTLIPLAAVVLLSGCFMPPPAEDPLAELQTTSAAPAYKSLALGITLSPGTLEAMKYAAGVNSQYWVQSQQPIPDLNAAITTYLAFLGHHFKTVTKLDGGANAPIDVMAVLDLHIDHVPATIFESAEFSMKTVFLTPSQARLGEASGHWKTEAVGHEHGHRYMQQAIDHSMSAMERGVLEMAPLQELAARAAPAGAAVASAAAKTYRSDVDQPDYQRPEDDRKFAVIVGIEHYEGLPAAEFAERDAAAMRRHLVALGYPERQIVTLSGAKATRTGIEKYVEEWLPSRVSPDSQVFFYFSGHGAPDVSTGQAYLVPWDGDPKYLSTTGYPLSRLYRSLDKLPTRHVVVALDSCFSGAGGRSVLAQGVRPLISKIDEGTAELSHLVVLAASGPDEVTGASEDQGHGLFTYEMLKALQDTRGKGTVRRLFDELAPRVEDSAHRDSREQTPRLLPRSTVEAAGLTL